MPAVGASGAAVGPYSQSNSLAGLGGGAGGATVRADSSTNLRVYALVQSRQGLAQARVSLFKAIGGGWNESDRAGSGPAKR